MGTASRVPSRGLPGAWWLGQWLFSSQAPSLVSGAFLCPASGCHQDGRHLQGTLPLSILLY